MKRGGVGGSAGAKGEPGDSGDKQRAGSWFELPAAPFRKLKWNGPAWVFFSPFNRNTQRVYPRVPTGPPRAKREEKLARTNGKEILLGVGARKFIAAPCVRCREPEAARETHSGRVSREREGEGETKEGHSSLQRCTRV